MPDTLSLPGVGWKARHLTGFIQHAGPLWAKREEHGWAYGIAVDSEHLNPAGTAHGGALMTLVDHALSAVAWEACDRTPCVTLQLDSHFVSPVRPGQFVEARAEVIQRTGSLVFMRGELRTGESLVLTAHALLKVMKP
ncbi:PaaI family thioesterase [Acidovorax sp. D2M1]|uniref:PaaI family thioesterase n=1 Tax=Acidovorax benzenivorans TaxID=2987520 RepID=A0ABT5S1T3_9BURK|nr:PaaI family thioesterase [Acidovorax benzenivorans]MDD2179913.1 PaaI family thioesterase [Acidovorax benzenivorans]